MWQKPFEKAVMTNNLGQLPLPINLIHLNQFANTIM